MRFASIGACPPFSSGLSDTCATLPLYRKLAKRSNAQARTPSAEEQQDNTPVLPKTGLDTNSTPGQACDCHACGLLTHFTKTIR
jgi:hypothetical protein